MAVKRTLQDRLRQNVTKIDEILNDHWGQIYDAVRDLAGGDDLTNDEEEDLYDILCKHVTRDFWLE